MYCDHANYCFERRPQDQPQDASDDYVEHTIETGLPEVVVVSEHEEQGGGEGDEGGGEGCEDAVAPFATLFAR